MVTSEANPTAVSQRELGGIKNLRTFLEDLRERHPEELLTIDRPISTKFEVPAVQVKLERMGKFPAILCENPVNVLGEPSPHRLITNVFASRRRSAAAIGIPPTEVAAQYTALSAKTADPIVVGFDEAPVHEVVDRGDAVDLYRFPVVWQHEYDVGPYCTGGFTTTIDPDTGNHNSSVQRLWVKARNKTGFYMQGRSDNLRNVQKWWARGEAAPIAVYIGHHPAAYLGCMSFGRIAYPESHYPYIAGLLGQPLRVTPTQTWGEQLMVPADAEIVIEGRVPPNHWEVEGPFGERPGYTGGQRPNPVIEVTAVTYRQDAIWQSVFSGHPDTFLLGAFALESQIYHRVKAIVPELLNVHLPISTGCRDNVYLQVHKTKPGIGRQALAACPGNTGKHYFVFDDDIDIFDERQVQWAIATRSQWDRDLIVMPGLRVTELDPSVEGQPGIGTKALLDCTMPPPPAPGLPSFYPPVSRVPAEVLARVELEEYASREAVSNIPVE